MKGERELRTAGKPARSVRARLGSRGVRQAPEIILEVVERVLAVLDVGDDDVAARNRVRELEGALGRDFLVAQTLARLPYGFRG